MGFKNAFRVKRKSKKLPMNALEIKGRGCPGPMGIEIENGDEFGNGGLERGG